MNPNWSRESQGPIGQAPDRFGEFHGFRLASWGSRVGAGIIDWLIIFGIPYTVLSAADKTLGWVVGLGIALLNSGYLAAKTTQSVGKRLLGIHMHWVKELDDGSFDLVYVPVPVALIRVPLHLLDNFLLFTGWFMPLFTRGHGTYADYLTRSINFRDPRLPPARHSRGGRVEYPGERQR